MTVDAWLAAALADAERRGLPALKPLLETLAKSVAALRRADEINRARESGERALSERASARVEGPDPR
jgi:hypothetical protein